ncbi:ESPR domain-containing protein [Burkholderia gladioli]|uniref:ESPR domain-containing protein n=1 Tax=Burkholderia gladioli TaxID=28095 RepID=UPI00244637A2|nr:ESPR domain-containing protein [Burkholderia gladioli]
MNKNAHRLVYSRLRGMVVAVAETATAEGKSASGEARRVKRSSGMRAAVVLAVSGEIVKSGVCGSVGMIRRPALEESVCSLSPECRP